jgi:hypothetical protein
MAHTEPLHPRHRKQASTIERKRGQRFQATATDLPGHHYPRLDAFRRQHAGVEAVIKDGKDLGLRRLPPFHLAFNQAWCTAVAIAADLLAWLRHLALDHHPQLRKATPATLRRAQLNVPARLVHRARKRLIRLDDGSAHLPTVRSGPSTEGGTMRSPGRRFVSTVALASTARGLGIGALAPSAVLGPRATHRSASTTTADRSLLIVTLTTSSRRSAVIWDRRSRSWSTRRS